MMKNLYCTCLLILLPLFGFGQKQITNFKNEENHSTNTASYQAMNELNVDLKDAGTIQIVDSKGREILKTAAGRASTRDVKTLPAGHYFLIYTGAGGKITRKIVKL